VGVHLGYRGYDLERLDITFVCLEDESMAKFHSGGIFGNRFD
jgi:hypothetical protein